ncbi:HPr family phosphocarrier protein [Acetatifactor muris]|uniref:HPr family phosphocarrier protein n=1 Tax=Acetatifactor muris TaxID=879566 RepID=UPI0011AF658B|nr:HPr family phosphocarrier protein [Acetatifactor muris]MCR2049725.1 HPr family phosphocarrier protein [Acetatifactor muris]
MKFKSDIDVIKDSYRVDAKSTLGILTVDLRKPLDVEIHSCNEEEVIRFNEEMEEFKWDQ